MNTFEYRSLPIFNYLTTQVTETSVRSSSRKPTAEERSLYGFALMWYEDHRKASLRLLKQLSSQFPYTGEAFRVSEEGNFGLKTSWSKDRKSLLSYSTLKPHKERIVGLDLEALVRSILFMDPSNSDLLEILDVREVIRTAM